MSKFYSYEFDVPYSHGTRREVVTVEASTGLSGRQKAREQLAVRTGYIPARRARIVDWAEDVMPTSVAIARQS